MVVGYQLQDTSEQYEIHSVLLIASCALLSASLLCLVIKMSWLNLQSRWIRDAELLCCVDDILANRGHMGVVMYCMMADNCE